LPHRRLLTFAALCALSAVSVGGGALAPGALGASPEAVVPPSPITLGDPDLPEGAEPDRDIAVVLTLTIETDGTVSAAEVAQSGGSPYDEAAVAAALEFLFTPATMGGRAIRVQVPFTYTFYARQTRRGFHPEDRQERRDIEPSPGFIYAGDVVERGTRAPQIGIPVQIQDPRTGRFWEVLTDDEGRFLFYGLPAGELVIDIFTGDFAPLRRRVQVRASDEVAARDGSERFHLDPGGLSAYRTFVQERRPPRAATVVDLQEEELRRVPGTFGDPTRTIATLPGVARSPFGLGYYVVRGAQFDNTGFFIDGHPALILYHLLGGPGVINPELVRSIAFYPGGYPARYGRFAAGVISVETKDPPRDRWHLDIDLDLFRAGVLFSVPFNDERGIVTVSFRRSYYELLLPLFTDDVSLSFTDYMLRVSYDFSPTVRGRFVAMGSEDAVSTREVDTAEGDGTSSSDLALGFHRVNIALDVDLNPTTTLTHSAVWEWDHTENSRVAPGDEDIRGNIAGWFAQLRSYVTAAPRRGLALEAGLDLLYTDYRADLAIPGPPPFGGFPPPVFDPIIIEAKLKNPSLSIAPYVSGNLELAPGLRVLPGLRVNFEDYGDRLQVGIDPKLAVRWELDDVWTLKGMAALAHQAPNIAQVTPPFGDPSLPLIRATQGSLGFEVRPASDWFISVEGFVQLLDNLPQPSSALVGTDGGEVARIFWDSDLRGRAFGAEVMLRKELGGPFYGWLTYTFSRAERWRGPERGWDTFELDQTHILNLAWSVRLGREWTLGLRFQLASGNPYYPIVGSRYDADQDRHIPLYAANRSRLDLYHRLDLRLDKRWRFDDWMFELYLDIQNVYNQPNFEAPRYSYDYALRTPGIAIPFLPTIGMRAVF